MPYRPATLQFCTFGVNIQTSLLLHQIFNHTLQCSVFGLRAACAMRATACPRLYHIHAVVVYDERGGGKSEAATEIALVVSERA